MAGKSYRKGITMMQLADMFPTDDDAREWFEAKMWPEGRHCPRCKSTETIKCTGKPPMPYWCPTCKRHFSVRVGTVMEGSPLPFRKWVYAIYLHLTSLKGVSSVKLGRDIGVRQATAWFMLQRIRKAFERNDDEPPFSGPIEIDESYFGGKRKNKSNAERKASEGRGPVDMTAVVGAKDRDTNKIKVKVVGDTNKATLQGFVADSARPGATVYTDDAAAYEGIPNPHKSVKHSVSEYVSGMAHTNGIESFWSMLKRAHKGVYHKFSPKHLSRYVTEFAGRHNIRESGTLAQMASLATGMRGKRLTYVDLIADNGLASGARTG